MPVAARIALGAHAMSLRTRQFNLPIAALQQGMLEGGVGAADAPKLPPARSSAFSKIVVVLLLCTCCGLGIACVMLEPFLPNKMAEVAESMDLGKGTFAERVKWSGLKSGSMVKKMAVFPRVEALDEQGFPIEA